MSTSYTKCGLGGAGNIRRKSSFSESTSSPLLSITTPASSFSTGIGGAANYRRDCPRRAATKFSSTSPPAHCGIGGAGNRYSPYTSQPAFPAAVARGISPPKARVSTGKSASVITSLSSSSSSDDSASSSFREKLGSLKERLAWSSRRILEHGLDDASQASRPLYTQIEA